MSLCKYLSDFYSEMVNNSMFLPILPKVYNNMCLFNDTNFTSGIKCGFRTFSLLEFVAHNHKTIPIVVVKPKLILKLKKF